jgi:hypothetical protein
MGDGVVSGGQDSYLFGDISADVVGDNSTKGTLKPQTVRYFYPSLMFAVGSSRPSKWSYNWASFGANLDYVATRRYDTQHNDIQPDDTQHNNIQPNDTQHNITVIATLSITTFSLKTLSITFK